MKNSIFGFLGLVFSILAAGASAQAEKPQGHPCSMRFGYAYVRNVRPSHLNSQGCEFQIEVGDPMNESGCSLEIGEVDSQVFQDSRCELSDGDSINGYVFRMADDTYQIDYFRNRRSDR